MLFSLLGWGHPATERDSGKASLGAIFVCFAAKSPVVAIQGRGVKYLRTRQQQFKEKIFPKILHRRLVVHQILIATFISAIMLPVL